MKFLGKIHLIFGILNTQAFINLQMILFYDNRGLVEYYPQGYGQFDISRLSKGKVKICLLSES